MSADKARTKRSIAQNRKARFEYEIEETFEVGIELVGSEVKSLRAGKCSFVDSWVGIENHQAYLNGFNIAEYPQANQFNHVPTRRRRLLMHRNEIERLFGRIREQGYSIVPMEIYFTGSWVKLTIGLGRGKKTHDKRESIKERDTNREMARFR